MRTERLRPEEDRAHGFVDARLGDVHRARHQPLTPLVRHAGSAPRRRRALRRSCAQPPEGSLRATGSAAKEREISYSARTCFDAAFSDSSARSRSSPRQLRALVQLRVLDRDCELRCEGRQQCGLVLRQDASAPRERHRAGRQPRPAARSGTAIAASMPASAAAAPAPASRGSVRTLLTTRMPRERNGPSMSSSKRSARRTCGPVSPSAAAAIEPLVLAEVNGETIRVEQLGDARDRRLERMRERELRDRLADDREQCTRPVELTGKPARTHARTQRMGGADAKGGKHCEVFLARREPSGEEQLQSPDRRLTELQGGSDVPVRIGEALYLFDRHGPPARERPLGHCASLGHRCRRGRSGRRRQPVQAARPPRAATGTPRPHPSPRRQASSPAPRWSNRRLPPRAPLPRRRGPTSSRRFGSLLRLP